MISPAMNWANYAIRPLGDADTTNYFGYGASVTGGYSIKNVFDLSIQGQYIPGSRGSAQFLQEQTRVYFVCIQPAFRLYETIFLAMRGGLADYQLLDKQNAD